MSYEYLAGLTDDNALLPGDKGPTGRRGLQGPTGPTGADGRDSKGKTPYNIEPTNGSSGFQYRQSHQGIAGGVMYYVLETALGSNLKLVQVTVIAANVSDSELDKSKFFTLKHVPQSTYSSQSLDQSIDVDEYGNIYLTSQPDKKGLYTTFTYYTG